jgi:hypothetical protein
VRPQRFLPVVNGPAAACEAAKAFNPRRMIKPGGIAALVGDEHLF